MSIASQLSSATAALLFLATISFTWADGSRLTADLTDTPAVAAPAAKPAAAAAVPQPLSLTVPETVLSAAGAPATPAARTTTVAKPVAPAKPAPAPAPPVKPSDKSDKSDKKKNDALPTIKPGSDVHISSDTMDADFDARIANLNGNVLVSDDHMRLQSDKMVIHYAEDNSLQQIEAMGRVLILRPDANQKARGGKAIYDVVAGTIVLTDAPVLITGPNTMSGAEKVIYNQKTGKFSTDGGRPTMIYVPEDGSNALDGVTKSLGVGTEKKKDGN